MKFINKLIIIFSVIMMLGACGTTELDLQDDPNAVTPDKAGVDFLFNSVEGSFVQFFNSTFYLGASTSRMTCMLSDNYNNAFSPASFNGIWSLAYSEMFPDVDALVALADDESRKLYIHSGAAKVMKAYVMVSLVDIFGDVPYAEAGKGTDPISPKVDPGATVYAAAEALLDEAIVQLDGSTAAKPKNDIIYAGNPAKWVTAAKTMKLKIALQTRLLNADDSKGRINKIIADGDFIDQASEDLQFQYGTNRENPNSRHPLYNNSYETADGDYMSNYYMWLMHGEKGEDLDDPRLRFYFYRQDLDLTDQIEDLTLWSCVYSNAPDDASKPQHYLDVDPNLPYCIASLDGYVGRDHGNGAGIPPDGNFRTVYGLYPAAGLFDDNRHLFTQKGGTLGAQGGGINPILLSSFVDFMRAEAALTIGTNDDARARLESGVRNSITKVLGFASKADLTIQIGKDAMDVPILASSLVPDQAQIDEYVAFVMDRYDNAPDKLDVVMKEYLIALWGNGIEAYNNFRRTGRPLKIQPGILPSIGGYMRTALYPAVHVNLNGNAVQRDITTRGVFWDSGPDVY